MTDIYLLITYSANDDAHIRQPHTTEAGAHARGRRLCAEDSRLWRYEVYTLEVIDDSLTELEAGRDTR
jgi:hypothetical protein